MREYHSEGSALKSESYPAPRHRQISSRSAGAQNARSALGLPDATPAPGDPFQRTEIRKPAPPGADTAAHAMPSLATAQRLTPLLVFLHVGHEVRTAARNACQHSGL